MSASEPRTQRSGVSGCPALPLTPLRCVRGSDADPTAKGLRLIFLAFFFPLAVYLLFLGFVNRHRHPLIVSGIWDGIGLIFGASGFLLFAGPAVLSTLSERWRLFWLLGKGDISRAAAEGAWPMGVFLACLYFLLIVGGAAMYLWRQRYLTAIYNTNAETVERLVIDICKQLGTTPLRSGDLFVLGSSPGIPPSREHKEAVSPTLPYERGSPAILEVDSFPLMRHVTLRWEPAAAPLRPIVESELSRRLSETAADDGLLGGWLLTLGFVLLMFDLLGAFFLFLLNLRLFLR